jgi:hypothetical protein
VKQFLFYFIQTVQVLISVPAGAIKLGKLLLIKQRSSSKNRKRADSSAYRKVTRSKIKEKEGKEV